MHSYLVAPLQVRHDASHLSHSYEVLFKYPMRQDFVNSSTHLLVVLLSILGSTQEVQFAIPVHVAHDASQSVHTPD